MPRFFVSPDAVSDDGTVTVVGDDAHHISRALRMAQGERITVCDTDGWVYDCRLESFLADRVIARIDSRRPSDTEPPYRVHLFQGLPKGDKLDSIIQKAVECGVYDITPFESENAVVRIRRDDAAAEARKAQRRQKIASEAAKQCGRGICPQVCAPLSFAEMLGRAKTADLCLFCYEGEGTVPLGTLLTRFQNRVCLSTADAACRELPEIAVVVGSEGGFSPREAEAARACGFAMTGLGKRILRTETAPIFVLSSLCCAFELSSCLSEP